MYSTCAIWQLEVRERAARETQASGLLMVSLMIPTKVLRELFMKFLKERALKGLFASDI